MNREESRIVAQAKRLRERRENRDRNRKLKKEAVRKRLDLTQLTPNQIKKLESVLPKTIPLRNTVLSLRFPADKIDKWKKAGSAAKERGDVKNFTAWVERALDAAVKA